MITYFKATLHNENQPVFSNGQYLYVFNVNCIIDSKEISFRYEIPLEELMIYSVLDHLFKDAQKNIVDEFNKLKSIERNDK